MGTAECINAICIAEIETNKEYLGNRRVTTTKKRRRETSEIERLTHLVGSETRSKDKENEKLKIIPKYSVWCSFLLCLYLLR